MTVENVYDIICRRYLQKKLNRHSYLATLNCKEHDSKAKKIRALMALIFLSDHVFIHFEFKASNDVV